MIQSISNRNSYPCLKSYTYLNQASLGLISDNSTRKMCEFLKTIASHGNIYMSDKDELELVNNLRIDASKLLGCQPNQTAILSSASEMLSQIPYIIKPKKNSEILMVLSDFPAVTRPWLKYSKEYSCSINFVKEDFKRDLTEILIENITPKTAVIQISLVQFSTGTKINLNHLSKRARSLGVKLIIDITQAAGAIPIFANKWNADFLVTSGYKWLGGHGGVGVACIGKNFLEKNPLNTGWMGVPNPFKMISNKCNFFNNAKSYTQSTMSYISIIGLQNSIKEIMKLDPSKMEKHSKRLSKFLLSEINKKRWRAIINKNKRNNSNHIISFRSNSKSGELDRIFKKLKKNKIICSLRNNKLRLSLAHFNNQKDLEYLIETLN